MFCPKCGTNVPDQFNFCFKCGFDLSAIRSSMNDSAPTEQSTVTKKMKIIKLMYLVTILKKLKISKNLIIFLT